MADTTVQEKLDRLQYGGEYRNDPLYVTQAVLDVINEEPKWAHHRLEYLAIEMTVVRGYFQPGDRATWRPLVMPNPKGVRTEYFHFWCVQAYGEDAYLITKEDEDLPDGFTLCYHEYHGRKG